MTIRQHGLAAVTAVTVAGIAPVAVSAASTPSPATVRAAVADPVETGFLEFLEGASGSLEGPFDATTYANSVASDSKGRGSVLQALHDYGFVTGYGRDWWKSGSSERLEEVVLVFADARGATTAARTSRTSYAKGQYFQSFFDAKLNDGAYGVTEGEDGYYWSVIVFTKGNDMFAIERGSYSDYPTAQSIAQAQKAFEFAPNSIDVPPPAVAGPGFLPNLRLLVIGALVLLLLAACAIAVGVFVVFKPWSPRLPAVEAEPKP